MNRVPQLILANTAVLVLAWVLKFLAFATGGGLAAQDLRVLRLSTVAGCALVSAFILWRTRGNATEISTSASIATATIVALVNGTIIATAYLVLRRIAPYGVGSGELLGLVGTAVVACILATVIVLKLAPATRRRLGSASLKH